MDWKGKKVGGLNRRPVVEEERWQTEMTSGKRLTKENERRGFGWREAVTKL